MRVLLELFRIILIFGLLGAISWAILESIYNLIPVVKSSMWLGGFAIFILLFVFYRNKFQFSGWYRGKYREKLPRILSIILISISVLLIIMPFALSFLVS